MRCVVEPKVLDARRKVQTICRYGQAEQRRRRTFGSQLQGTEQFSRIFALFVVHLE